MCCVDGTFRAGVITDVHLAPEGSPPGAWHNPYDFAGAESRLAAALELFAEEDVDAVFVLGDVAHYGDPPSFARVERTLASSPAPTWIAPGNHDLLEALPAFMTSPPADGRITVLTPGDVDLDLGDGLAIVLSHYPLVSRQAELTARGLKYAGDLSNRAELLATLKRRPGPTVVFSGHLHVRDSAADGPVLQLLFPATIEHPYECAIVELEGREIRRRAIALHTTPAVSDPLLSAERETWLYSERTASSSVRWTDREM
jgi:predicted phosphodiesterase